MPSANNVAGPLFFMGASLLRLQEASFVDNSVDNLEALAIILVMKTLVLVMFILPILILMIVNMIRILWIWVWAVLSPFIVLDHVFS